MSDLTRNIHGDEMEVWLISRAATETSTRGRRQFADWVERDVARRDTQLQAIADMLIQFDGLPDLFMAKVRDVLEGNSDDT